MTSFVLQVAELCRLSFPDKPWMALVGLLHGLGKLLAHPMWGSQPQWAVAGESFPVGCKFAPQISASEFFSANPDRCDCRGVVWFHSAPCCHCLSHSMGSAEYKLCLPLPDNGLAMHTGGHNHGRRKTMCCADLGVVA